MKHLTLFLLLSTSAAFSQDTSSGPTDTAWWIKNPPFSGCLKLCAASSTTNNPDTSRAIVLVTLSPNGIAHARMGFVVIQTGKTVVYLDCRKRALKWPQVGWDWREVDINYKSK